MSSERRRHPRTEKELQVHFVSADDEQAVKGTGVTQNVSRGGIYFKPRHWRREKPLRRGDRLRLRVDGRRCDGRVLRVDEADSSARDEHPGIAVRFHGSPNFERLKMSA